jgi:excisionase family DNA binding protein
VQWTRLFCEDNNAMKEIQCNKLKKYSGHENLLHIDAVAERLNISPHPVRGLVWKRKLSHIKIGTRVLFRPQDLEDFIQANLVKSFECDNDKS